MPKPKPNFDFEIYVDQSCQNTPDEELEPVNIGISSEHIFDATNQENTGTDVLPSTQHCMRPPNDQVNMARDNTVRPSIEDEHLNEMEDEEADQTQDYEDEDEGDEVGDDSTLSDDNEDPTQSEHSYHADDGGDSSSHHEATDEDVFSDKSPRSSMGSYDSNPDTGKSHKDFDNMTTIHSRSPRISDISQYEKEYEKEDFVPTARGTPRPPFRTPSDVRAMQMSSPPASVLGSPRSAKKHFPTVSRLGTPNTSTQYSPKRMSTPPRFKSRKEAPLVLLHATIIPLSWVWGDLMNILETEELNDQTKTLRENWRLLQDHITNTVLERGVLVKHPQDDYEVLEERLLEALQLPLRRRARILECGHYIGPTNEGSVTEDEESEDEGGSSKHHWCATCKDEIRHDPLGKSKIFRVKAYASNGLMSAGAWEACWKEMERVDVELEPIVEAAVQDELVRLAALRGFTPNDEAKIADEIAQKLKAQKEESDFMNANTRAYSRAHSRAHSHAPSFQPDEPRSPRSETERRWRDEQREREIYGESPLPSSPRPASSRRPPTHPQQDSYMPSSSPRPTSPYEAYEQNAQKPPYQNASLPELILQSVRVLVQDRRNIIIFGLSVFVLVLALRNAPSSNEPIYEPVIHRMRDIPSVRRAPIADAPEAPPMQVKAHPEDGVVKSIYDQFADALPQYTLSAEPVATPSDFLEPQEPKKPVDQQYSSAVVSEESTSTSTSEQDQTTSTTEVEVPQSESLTPQSSETVTSEELPKESDMTSTEPAHEESPIAVPQQEAAESESIAATLDHEEPVESPTQPSVVAEESTNAGSCSTVYEPCSTPALDGKFPAFPAAQQDETETVTEKKVVRVVHTVTQTEVETATEIVKVAATEAANESESTSASSVDADAEHTTTTTTQSSSEESAPTETASSESASASETESEESPKTEAPVEEAEEVSQE